MRNSDSVSLDRLFLRVDSLSPGFGGIFWEGEDSLVVAHTNSDALGSTLAAVAEVMGDIPALHAKSTRLKRVDYSFSQLWGFRSAIDRRRGSEGLILLDVDEVQNRLSYGVEAPAIVESVRAAVRAEGIPDAAVVATVVPVPAAAALLNQRRDTTAGGLRITEYGTGFYCSLGFNATRWGTSKYMVTAAHCAPPIGSASSSEYYAQDVSSSLSEAQEFSDPSASSTVSGCLSGKVCRNSDAVMFQWITSQTFGLGMIAAPDTVSSSWSSGSLFFNKYFTVAGELPNSYLINGTHVSKVGSVTGLSRGSITTTCNYLVWTLKFGLDIPCTFLTDVPVWHGDSGGPFLYGWPSPVTPPSVSYVQIVGLFSYFDDENLTFSAFTSWSGILADFGNLMTYPTKPCC